MIRAGVCGAVAVLISLATATSAGAASTARLGYASYIGAQGRNTAERVVLDQAGNTYLSGWLEGDDFPTPDGSPVALSGGIDVYVTKLSPAGKVLYTTVFGGAGNDLTRSLAVDGSGNAYVGGETYSADFPVVGAQPYGSVGGGAAFVTKLDPSGAIERSTYVGGNNAVTADDLALGPGGSVYLAGYTLASNLPVTPGAFQSAKNGALDAWVLAFGPDLQTLRFCTYLGGGGHPAGGLTSYYDEAYGIETDAAGNAYIGGVTDAVDFPTTTGAAQAIPGGQRDAFASKLSADGKRLIWSTRVGGVGDDQASEMTIDPAGAVYLVGHTASPNFPSANAFQRLPGSVTDAFVTKIDPTGSSFAYSTFLGGSGADYGYGIAVDGVGRATAVGQTASANFPVAGAFQTAMRGTADGFVTRLSADGSAADYSSFLGGSDWDGLTGVTSAPDGSTLVSGFMYSGDMPSPRPFAGPYDGYLARITTG